MTTTAHEGGEGANDDLPPFLRGPKPIARFTTVIEKVEHWECPICGERCSGSTQNLNEEPARRVFKPCGCEWLEGRDA